MKRALYLLTAVALGAAMPAAAGDMLYPGGTMLSETLVGKPYWAVQARCAGLYGAASSYFAEQGRTGAADEARAEGVSFMREAIDRLMTDRGVARPAAIEALSPGVLAGREEGLQALNDGGAEPNSKWNFARSLCLDVRDVYHGLTPPAP